MLHRLAVFFRLAGISLTLFCGALLLLPREAHAAVITWDGGGGADTNWNTCANWSGNTCPGTGDIATFDATSTNNAVINAPINVAGIDINTGYTGTISQANGQSVTVGGSSYDQADGTFTATDAPVNINANFTLSGGTFTAPSGAAMSIQGGFTHTVGGTFNHNNGTVRFVNAADTTINVNTTETFYNLIQDKTTNWQVTVAAGDTLVVNNFFTLNDGRFLGSASSFVDVKNTMSVAANWDGGTINVKFSGAGDQSLSLPSPALWDPVASITIDKTTGNFTLGSDLTLDCGGAGCNFILNQGTVDLSTRNLRVNDFSLVSGTLTSGASTIDIDDDLSITAGTFNAPTSSMTLGGDFLNTGSGVFNHNNGVFIFDTAADQTINVNTSQTFYSVTMDKNNFQETITSGDTIVVLGNLNLTNGRFQTGTIEMQGATTTVGSSYDTGTATLKFAGSGSQTFNLTGAEALFDGPITVDKTGGTVTLASGLTMQSGQTLKMANGTFDAGNNTLSFQPYSQTGGTFTAGSGTLDFNNTFTLSGGTFNAASGTTIFGNAFTHTAGGTFNHNNGSVVFDTAADNTYNVATTETFYNLKIDKALNGATISSGDTFIVLGTLDLAGGRFLTGTLEARGDILLGNGYASANTSPLLISGGNTQTLTVGSTASGLINADITVNKSAGSVKISGAELVLDAANQDLVIQEGTFDLGGQNLAVNGTSGTLVVESGGNLQLQGGETVTANASNPQLQSGSMVTYNGNAGSYTLKDYTYHHLAIAGGSNSVFALAANESLAGNLTITSGILDQATRTLTVTGTFANNGVLRRRQSEAFTGTMDVDSGTVEYVGDGDATPETVTITDFGVTDYYNLKINDSNGTKDIFRNAAQLTVAGQIQTSSAVFQLGSGNAVSAATLVIDGGTLDSQTSTLTVSGLTSLSSGNFDGGSATIGLGALVISGGTLSASTGTMSVAGDWTHTAGGTFTHNGGTVQFTSSTATIDVATSETFSALTINKQDGVTLAIASGDTLIASGALTLSNGLVSSGALEARGDVTVQSGYDSGTAVLKFTGTATQNFNLTGAASVLDHAIVIDKSGGEVTLASALTLDAASADLTLSSGTFAVSGQTVTTTAGSDIAINGGAWNSGAATLSLSGLVTIAGGTWNGDNSTSAFSGGFVLSSGAYNGNISTPTFSGGLTMSGGTFTASSATTRVSGSWTHTVGGAFAHNGGTMEFTGNAALIDVATSETFAALVVAKNTGEALTISSGDSLITTDTLVLADGMVSSGTLEAQAAVTINAGYDAGSATLKFSGTGTQLWTLTGAVDKYDGPIVVDKSGGSVTLASALTLDAGTADFTLTNGTFAAGDYAVTTAVGSDIAINGGAFNAGASTLTLAGAVNIAGGTWNGQTSTLAVSGPLTLSSGAWNGGEENNTFSGGVTVSGGVFAATTAVTEIRGGYTHTAGGTFTHNNGTLQFAGTAQAVDVATSETFGVLVVAMSNGQALQIASGDTLVAAGALTLSNGIVNTGALEARGAVTVGAGFDGGDGPLKFAGGSAQSFNLAGATDKFNGDIQVAKSAGTVTLGSALTMDAAGQDFAVTSGTFSTSDDNYTLAVTGDVSLNGGTFNANGSIVDLAGNWNIAGGAWNGGSSTVMVAGDITYSSGTMTPSTSTVILDGADQQINGSPTFAGFTKVAASDQTLSFDAGETVSITGTLTLQGTSEEAMLSLRSTVEDTQAMLHPTGDVATLQFLDVQDSNNLGSDLDCTDDCIDSGNNDGWSFRRSSDDNTPSVVVPSSVQVVIPNGGTTHTVGDPLTLSWLTTGSVGYVNILYSTDGGASWSTIASRHGNTGSYSWRIPSGATDSGLVKVQGTDLATVFTEDTSDATFTVLVPSTTVTEEEEVEETPVGDVETDEEILAVVERLASLPSSVRVHSLVKLPDDRNPATTEDSAVYYVGADGRRHAFPNLAVYRSWFCDFSGVQAISVETLAKLELGENITYRPGYKMVKFITSPKVYAVDQYGVLRWVVSEELAAALYGNRWVQRIDDVSDAFSGNYAFGAPIMAATEFDPDTKQTQVAYPSDSMYIPGYAAVGGGTTQCE